MLIKLNLYNFAYAWIGRRGHHIFWGRIAPFLYFGVLMFAAIESEGITNGNSLLKNDSIQKWLNDHIKYECNLRPELTHVMESMIPKIIGTGLQNLNKINPELVTTKLAAAKNRKLLISCIADVPNRVWAARYTPFPVYIDEKNLRFSWTGNIIVVPVPEVEKLRDARWTDEDLAGAEQSDFQFALTAQGNIDSENQENIRYVREFSYTNLASSKSIIFHEYLHFLDFDNASTKAHNSVKEPHSLIQVDDDMVYACSHVVYPTFKYRFDGAKACYLCAMAREVNHKLRVDVSRFEKAAMACALYRKFESQNYRLTHGRFFPSE